MDFKSLFCIKRHEVRIDHRKNASHATDNKKAGFVSKTALAHQSLCYLSKYNRMLMPYAIRPMQEKK